MLQPRLPRAPSTFDRSLTSLASTLNALSLCPKHSHLQPLIPVRHASHAQQGRANGPGDSAGRRLGLKRGDSEYVVPGNIIFKQRGTKWFPGENVGIGKDHTIYAVEHGYVRYYRNPTLHPKRRYIGVALEREGPLSKLPTPPNAPTRRRLGMYAAPISTPIDDPQTFLDQHLTASTNPSETETSAPRPTNLGVIEPEPRKPVMREATARIANFEIGRMMDKTKDSVRPFDKRDRFYAWRKRKEKVQAKILARAARATRKTKGKKSLKGAGKMSPRAK